MRALAPPRPRIATPTRQPLTCIFPVFNRRAALPPLRQHPFDRPDDPDIAGAAAEIAAELAPDPRLVRLGQAGDDVARRGQHARRAEAALERVLGGEGGAELRHYRVVVEALDRADLRPVAGDRQGDAGARRGAVDHHRAGTADAVLAAEMRAGEMQG